MGIEPGPLSPRADAQSTESRRLAVRASWEEQGKRCRVLSQQNAVGAQAAGDQPQPVPWRWGFAGHLCVFPLPCRLCFLLASVCCEPAASPVPSPSEPFRVTSHSQSPLGTEALAWVLRLLLLHATSGVTGKLVGQEAALGLYAVVRTRRGHVVPAARPALGRRQLAGTVVVWLACVVQ